MEMNESHGRQARNNTLKCYQKLHKFVRKRRVSGTTSAHCPYTRQRVG